MDGDGPIPAGGTALVVVPGVGDDAPGDTVGSMTAALLRELGPEARAIPYTRAIVVPPRPGSDDAPAVHDVRCAALIRPGAPTPLTVYEMHWADLSRFPTKGLRFVLTLYGMLFQVGVFGLEAFRATERWRWQRALIRAFSYLTVVVIVGLTAGAAILGVEFSAATRFPGHGPGIAIATVTLLVSLALAGGGDTFLRARGWRFGDLSPRLGRHRPPLGRPLVALGLIALGIGIAPLAVRIDRGGGMAFAVHSVLWFSVRWILPLAWAAIGVIAIAVSLTQLRLTPGAGATADDERRYRANRTAVLSVVVGGLGIAVMGALLVATALGLVIRLVGTDRGIPPEVTADMPGAPVGFADYAGRVFAHSLQPLGVALLSALVLLALVLAAGFRYGSALAQTHRSTRPLARGWPALAGAVVPLAVAAVLLRGDSAAADLMAVILLAVAVVLVALSWVGRFRPDPARMPVRRGFDALLRYLASFGHVLALVGALMASAVALLLATPLTSDAGDRLGRFSDAILTPVKALSGSTPELGSAAQISATVVVLVAVAALLRTRLSAVARAIDVAYDVVTYLRVTHGAPSDHDPVEPPRRQVLRRYAALLGHIDAVQRPERIVIAAHSQGSMYSLALLFRDEQRDRADVREDRGWTVAPSRTRPADVPAAPAVVAEPFPALGAELRLVTAGCPVLQTYSPNFPAQYEWPADVAAATARMEAAEVASWRNLYRSGDYFGRALWSATCDAEMTSGRLSERCLGPGHHTGYWGDPRFAREVLALV